MLVVTLAVAWDHAAAGAGRPPRLSVSGGTIAVDAGARAGMSTAMVLPRCHTAHLRGFIASQTGGAGSVFTTLALRNVGRWTCGVLGYPGVSLVDRAYRQIGRPATRDAGVVLLVVLRPGESASTMVRTLNPGVGTTRCLPPSVALRVYPPDETTSLLVPARLSECLGTLQVRPLVAGMSGS